MISSIKSMSIPHISSALIQSSKILITVITSKDKLIKWLLVSSISAAKDFNKK